MSRDKVKEFVKKHKTEFIAGAGIVVGGVLLAIAKKTTALPEGLSCPMTKGGIRNIPVPKGFAIGTMTDLWEEGGFLNSIVEEITADDLGNLGKEFVKSGLIADGEEASVIVGFMKKE